MGQPHAPGRDPRGRARRAKVRHRRKVRGSADLHHGQARAEGGAQVRAEQHVPGELLHQEVRPQRAERQDQAPQGVPVLEVTTRDCTIGLIVTYKKQKTMNKTRKEKTKQTKKVTKKEFTTK